MQLERLDNRKEERIYNFSLKKSEGEGDRIKEEQRWGGYAVE